MEFINKHKKMTFLILTIFCIAAIIFTINYRKPTFIENIVGYLVSPGQEVSGNIGDWFKDKVDFISNLNELEDENRKLKEEMELLRLEANRAGVLDQDNQELRGLLELSQRYPQLPVMGADIIANDSNNWSNKFLINAGTKDGIEENMVVLASGGLVGKIYKAGYNYSQVITIVDDMSSVSAVSKRSNDTGFVKGDLKLSDSGLCKMDNIDLDADILENDEIITSDLGVIYPPGITIGYVREVGTDTSGLSKTAVVSPVVDFKTINSVLVVTQSFEKEFLDTEPAVGDVPSETEENNQ